LDCDILANRNIKELYKIDLEKNLVGANNFVAFFKEDFKFYFNSGVLLINNKLMREENITEQCLKYMAGHSDLCNPDEQTLNEICKNRVKYIPYIYNYQPWYCESEDALQKTGANKLSDIYIIHYGKKPWNNPHSPLADKWWKTAKSLPKDIYEQIKEKYNFSGKCKPQGYYKYYFANPINKFFIKLKRKIFKYRGKNE